MSARSTRNARDRRPSGEPVDLDVSELAHSLANVVQVVSGNLELLAARTNDPKALRYVENARTAAEQLAELTRKLRAGGE